MLATRRSIVPYVSPMSLEKESCKNVNKKNPYPAIFVQRYGFMMGYEKV